MMFNDYYEFAPEDVSVITATLVLPSDILVDWPLTMKDGESYENAISRQYPEAVAYINGFDERVTLRRSGWER